MIVARIRLEQLAAGPCCPDVGMSARSGELGWASGSWPSVLEVEGPNGIQRYKQGPSIQALDGSLHAVQYGDIIIVNSGSQP